MGRKRVYETRELAKKAMTERSRKRYYEKRNNSHPSLYYFYDSPTGDILYVGSTLYLKHRLQRHNWCFNNCNKSIDERHGQKVEHIKMYQEILEKYPLGYSVKEISLPYSDITPEQLREEELKLVEKLKPLYNKRKCANTGGYKSTFKAM